MRNRAVTIFTLSTLVAAGIFLLVSPLTAKPAITWSPPGLAVKVIAGNSVTVQVSFTASRTIHNAEVLVSFDLSSVLTVTPSSLGTVHQGQTVTLNVSVKAPATSTPGNVEGTLIVQRDRDKSAGAVRPREYDQPLPVTVHIAWPAFTDPAGSYSIEYPPFLAATFVEARDVLLIRPSSSGANTESPGIVVSREPNPEGLSVVEFFDGAPGIDLFGQSLGIFSTSTLPNGAVAYVFDPVVTFAGGHVVVVPGPEEFIVIHDQGLHRVTADAVVNSLILH
jgi:hypothetical protein